MNTPETGTSPNPIYERIAILEQVTPLVTERVPIPGTSTVLDVTRPAEIDALLDTVMNDPEQNLPYWAEIWPSGIALASTLLQSPDLVRGKPVVELGCGVGITAAAAMMAGADLTVTDYAALSLVLTELTCLQAGVALPTSRQVNWRDERAHVLQDSGDPWPVILAGDVLYEERDIEPVLMMLEKMLTPDGTVLLAEPGRQPAREAVKRARSRGWQIETSIHRGPWPDPKDKDVVVSVHVMKR